MFWQVSRYRLRQNQNGVTQSSVSSTPIHFDGLGGPSAEAYGLGEHLLGLRVGLTQRLPLEGREDGIVGPVWGCTDRGRALVGDVAGVRQTDED